MHTQANKNLRQLFFLFFEKVVEQFQKIFLEKKIYTFLKSIEKYSSVPSCFLLFFFLNWLWVELLTPDNIIIIYALPLVCWDWRMRSGRAYIAKTVTSINPRNFWGRICFFGFFYFAFTFFLFFFCFKALQPLCPLYPLPRKIWRIIFLTFSSRR